MPIDYQLIYEKFLMIEGWAYRAKKLAESKRDDKIRLCIPYIEENLKEVKLLLENKD